MSSTILYHLGVVRDESFIHSFEREKEMSNPPLNSDSLTLAITFLSPTSKIAASVIAFRIFYIPFLFLKK